MNYGFMTLKALLIDYNQFRKSMLQDCIMNVLDCSYKTAFALGKKHCNLLSTWALLYCQEIYLKSYEEFFRECLEKGICNKEGYFNIDKIDIDGVHGVFTRLGVKCKITKYNLFPDDLKKNQFYQIAINGKHHFIATASADDGNLYLFDTNDREYGAELFQALKDGDKITWIKKFEKAE